MLFTLRAQTCLSCAPRLLIHACTSRRWLASSAVQDCRGRFKSKGTFYKYVGEAEDGYDSVEWIAEQPWSNGNVVTDGCVRALSFGFRSCQPLL
jgi:predicted acyl esterase